MMESHTYTVITVEFCAVCLFNQSIIILWVSKVYGYCTLSEIIMVFPRAEPKGSPLYHTGKGGIGNRS